MFKMIIGFYLASTLLMGCSKTSPNIQVKDKIIEKNLRTYDALTASKDMQLSDETDLDLIIHNIRSKRQIGFEWKTFWVKASENITPVKISDQTGEKLFSLSKLSCEEAPDTSFIILQYAEKGLDQELKTASGNAVEWLKYFQTVVQDCQISENDSFIFRYKSVLSNILQNGNKKLKVMAFSDLNTRLSSTRNSLLSKEARDLFNTDQKLLNISNSSLTDSILLAHVFKELFPYRANPFLELIINEAQTASTGVEYYEDFGDALVMLSRIDVSVEKIPQITNSLIDVWSKNSKLADTLTTEEKINYFDKQYSSAEVLMSFLESELSSAKNKSVVLDKAEKLIRNLEASLFALPHPEDMILKKGKEELNLILDFRHAKKTGQSLAIESSAVEKIKRLSDVFLAFHRMHNKGDTSLHLAKFCEWIGTNKLDSLNSVKVGNGCYEIASIKVNQALKIEAESFKTPLFSVIKFPGDLSIKSKIIDVGVIDLTQTRAPETSSARYSRKLESIVFPLVMGFELQEDFLDIKKDKLYFFPYQFIYRASSPGLAHIQHSKDGHRGGNLILTNQKRSESFMPTFVSEGGYPASVLPGNKGGRGVSYTIDMFKIEEWLGSSAQGESYPLEVLSAKNLKILFSKMKKNNQYKTIVKVEPDFINHIGSIASGVFEESLKLARDTGVLTSPGFMEELSGLAMNSLLSEIEFKISQGESLGRLSVLGPSLELPSAADGSEQEMGSQGAKGKIIYE